jgi:hypothetical protein
MKVAENQEKTGVGWEHQFVFFADGVNLLGKRISVAQKNIKNVKMLGYWSIKKVRINLVLLDCSTVSLFMDRRRPNTFTGMTNPCRRITFM